ncbi:hypothetical protein ACFFRR_011089 [Megaselia abdita]
MDDLGAEYLSEMSVVNPTPNLTPQTPNKEQHSLDDITPVLEDLYLDSSDEGKEKTDATPENIKKIDDVITLSTNANEVTSDTTTTGVSMSSSTCNVDDDDSLISQQLKNNMAMAFTIDFGGNRENSLSEQQAAKYKNIMERFQNRHKRGASMSKLESSGESSVLPPPPTTTAAKVKLRIRERSTSGVRDSSKRHSWSPRSSTHEASAPPVLPTPRPTPPPRVNVKNSANAQKGLAKTVLRKKEAFAPKSIAMQKAMEKFEFYLPEPPLISNGKNVVEADGISEAGTYTLDGDNYTEEQKELMNIDDEHPAEQPMEWKPKPQEMIKSNVLEVSYFHDSTNVIPEKKPSKTSYLEKIKTRVRANFKSSSSDKDCGTFTSITTSGVLAKRSVLNSAPAGGRRKNSLSKSQIDSSEYISRERGLTDHQKSEYRLNVFTNQTDSQLLSSLESDVTSLKTAQTKNDWIQEWARNARARSVATTDMSCSFSNDYDYSSSDPNLAKLLSPRPPKSPTKIPSPMHTTRLAVRTRASLQNLIGIELSDSEDPNMYLEKTKMLINNLQENISRRNSLKSANTSPKKSAHTTPGISLEHKRNFSLDYHIPSRNHQSHQLSPRNRPQPKQQKYTIDQTTTSPLRRSSSFSVKPLSASSSSMVTPNGRRTYQPQAPAPVRRGVPLQKSASSNSFRKMYSDYDDNVEYYINDEDDLVDNDYYSSDEEFGATSGDYYDDEEIEMEQEKQPANAPRYNKALLMRIERSKQKVGGSSGQQQPPTSAPLGGCRNTPEMPRRNVNSAGIRSSMRQSMPRDTSLNRLKNEPACVPSSLASAKKQLLQTATNAANNNTSARVQPKYMDISKYKPAQSANFLRKNEAKSTLKPEIKRSPSNVSSATINNGFSRGDSMRVSNRSVKSAGYKPSLQGNNNRMRDSSVNKQKEAELEMWKRRAKYDPMKAAAEDKRKKEEAKRLAQGRSTNER